MGAGVLNLSPLITDNPMPINSPTVAIGTVAIVAADVFSITTQYPLLAVMLASSFSAIIGTVFWQLSQGKEMRKKGVVLGYLVVCNGIAIGTYDLTASQILTLTGSEYIANLWDLPIATRYGFLSFIITQATTGWQGCSRIRRGIRAMLGGKD